MLNRFLLLDLECIAAPDAEQWLSPIEPDRRYTDPVKIAADLAAKREAQLASAALDADLATIVAVGYETEDGPLSRVAELVTSPDAERRVLETVWQLCGPSRPMVGYGLSWYDAGVLVRRSQLLDVLVPHWIYKQGKYRHESIIELADYLTLNGMIEQKKGRGLDYHCKRFGILIEDAITGKDVGKAWADGDIEAVRLHVQHDIERIKRVAQRLRVIDGDVQKAVA